jgi:hypothetical protein
MTIDRQFGMSSTLNDLQFRGKSYTKETSATSALKARTKDKRVYLSVSFHPEEFEESKLFSDGSSSASRAFVCCWSPLAYLANWGNRRSGTHEASKMFNAGFDNDLQWFLDG